MITKYITVLVNRKTGARRVYCEPFKSYDEAKRAGLGIYDERWNIEIYKTAR